jgi:hypothetical protein
MLSISIAICGDQDWRDPDVVLEVGTSTCSSNRYQFIYFSGEDNWQSICNMGLLTRQRRQIKTSLVRKRVERAKLSAD